jgi:hypothetical protein
MSSASDRHRRRATRKRCTDSGFVDFRTRLSAFRTRLIREDNPTRLDRRTEGREVSEAIDANTVYKPNDIRYLIW